MNQQSPPTVVAQQADVLGNLYQVIETESGDTIIQKYRPARSVALSEYQDVVEADGLDDVTDHLQAGGFTPLDDNHSDS